MNPLISNDVQKSLNAQLNAEAYSSYLYLSMSAYFESVDLPGFANWMRVQAREEDVHVQKFFDYIHQRGGRVTLEAIEKPQTEWKNSLAAFEAAYAHERKISTSIDNLVRLAREQRDAATESFLRWFVDEQVEEEASVDKVLKTIRLTGEQPVGVLMLDRELATRTFVPPAPAGGAAP
jgi:ferritin